MITILPPTHLFFKLIFEKLREMGLEFIAEDDRILHRFSNEPGTDDQLMTELLCAIQQHRQAALAYLKESR